MIFRQLFESESSTYTYLIACEATREAALIDPVLESVDRDLALLGRLGLALTYTIETHIHADHVTGAARLRKLTGSKIVAPHKSLAATCDVAIAEGDRVTVGSVTLEPLYTPGHTDDHHAYLLRSSDGLRIFTGDALMIDGCGRTDFQNGDASTLYRSVHDKIFALPSDTLVYPGHDYQQRRVSTIGQEHARNPRLGEGKTLEEFVSIMDALNLPPPRKMDLAVPANRRCGEMRLA